MFPVRKMTRLCLMLLGIMVFLSFTAGMALAKKTNPPGPKGGRGTDWANPPGPKGGPGTSKHKKDKYWWKTTTPYQKWKRAQLLERLEELKEHRSELMASGADADLVEEINEEIDDIEDTLLK